MKNVVRVLSTLALKGAVQNLAGRFEAAGGARIDADFAPTLGLLDRLQSGESADVVILTREGLDGLAAQGSVVAETCVDLARSYVGIAVKAGADHPDIATVAALRATLLGAKSVAYSRIGASGIFFVGPIPRELQTAAVFSAGRLAASVKAVQSDALLNYLASAEVAPVLRAAGLAP